MSGRARLLLSIPYSMCARNVLRSDAFDILRGNADLMILTPLAEDAAFRREFGKDGVEIRPSPALPLPVKAALKLWIEAETLRWVRRNRIRAFEIIEASIRAGVADDLLMANAGIFSLRSRAVARAPLLLPLLRRALAGPIARSPGYADLLRGYRPDLVFLTHPHTWEERVLSLSAARAGVPTAAIIHSWDNVTTKPMLLSRYRRMLVWNDILKDQLVRLYGYEPEQVSVVGMPQADAYCRQELLQDRASFLRGLGLDPARKLVTYACACPEFVPDQHEIVDVLVKAMDSGRLASKASLLIRLHPGRDMDWARKYRGRPDVRVDVPSIAYNANRCETGWTEGRADVAHFVNILKHSDVFVNAFSTTTIDAAAMDVPVVNIAFDAREPKPYLASVVKHYDWEHYRPIVETAGVRLAKSPEQLIEQVNAYLADRALDREGRRRIVEQQCHRLDGRSGERIARCILQEMRVSLS